ncbi:hypothetical protein [Dyella flagellata]|uniref:DUF4123 domain-containing protein n=1 Tax=Dyella flagellata TaxID=1867833 RepID=A0ABQ5XCI0_9GAMM|nr:hypothetical protein [Dyella flagellata]GLQ89167.1 hypothetical protein GCM10007898_27390 [Dyella flagellata]
MTVVLYSQCNDPLVAAIKASGKKWLFLHVDELLDGLSIKPWPVLLDLTVPSAWKEQIVDASVVNRLFSFEGTTCMARLSEARINERWLHARLDTLLATASVLSHDTGVRGVSRSLLPLNAQWFHMRTGQSAVSTPRFSYATGFEEPDNGELDDPMQKSVWSLFDWKSERHLPSTEARRHRFFVDRPTGTPLVCFFAGEQAPAWFFPKQEAEFDDEALTISARTAQRVFLSDIGEMLLYVNADGSLVFHAFSPYLQSAIRSPEFSEYLNRWEGPRRQVFRDESRYE